MFRYEIGITGAGELSVRYKDAPALVHTTTVTVMRRIVARLHDYAVKRKLSGSPLKARTRTLARALFHRVELVGQDIVGRVGVDLAKAIYGRAHEKGAVITPKRGTYLTIPVGQALTASGVARFDAREFIAATAKGGPGIGKFTGSFVNNNRTAIMGVTGSGRVEPVFALKRRVELPARPFLSSTLAENEREVVHELETGIVEAVKKL